VLPRKEKRKCQEGSWMYGSGVQGKFKWSSELEIIYALGDSALTWIYKIIAGHKGCIFPPVQWIEPGPCQARQTLYHLSYIVSPYSWIYYTQF
jgi:hypothetical protein